MPPAFWILKLAAAVLSTLSLPSLMACCSVGAVPICLNLPLRRTKIKYDSLMFRLDPVVGGYMNEGGGRVGGVVRVGRAGVVVGNCVSVTIFWGVSVICSIAVL